MIEKINRNNTPKYLMLNSFSSNPKARNGYLSYRYHRTRDNERNEAIRAGIGAAVGTIIPLMMFAKKQNVNPLKVHYGLKEIMGVSAGSIVGGVLGGMIKSDYLDRKQKVNEGIFQFSNAALPPVLAVTIEAATKNVKAFNTKMGKIATTGVGLIGGMFAAAKLSNFICDPKDKVPDRKLTFKDSLANIDDALGILAMSDFPALQKVAGPLLPVIYAFCGYRAGESN